MNFIPENEEVTLLNFDKRIREIQQEEEECLARPTLLESDFDFICKRTIQKHPEMSMDDAIRWLAKKYKWVRI